MTLADIKARINDLGYVIVGLKEETNTSWIVRPNKQTDEIKWDEIEKTIRNLPPGVWRVCGRKSNRSTWVEFKTNTAELQSAPAAAPKVLQDHSRSGTENLTPSKSIDFERLGRLEALCEYQARQIGELKTQIESLEEQLDEANAQLTIYENEQLEDAAQAAEEQLAAGPAVTPVDKLIDAALPAVPALMDAALEFLTGKKGAQPTMADPGSAMQIDYTRLAQEIHKQFANGQGSAEQVEQL